MKQSKSKRFTIRWKLTIISAAAIVLLAATLGIFLSSSFQTSAFELAQNTLSSVSKNAYAALDNSLATTSTSMRLLSNQIGYNDQFANSILTADDPKSIKKLSEAMSGADGSGGGNSIIGAMDYLLYSDADIDSVTMYSPFVQTNIWDRLLPIADNDNYTEERYAAIKAHSGTPLWFFVNNDGVMNLYAWKAIINFGVEDNYDMQVVGYVEYAFRRDRFLACLTDTAYSNEGMYLIDENGNYVLNLSCGETPIDEEIKKKGTDVKTEIVSYRRYTTYASKVERTGWTYVTYINHNDVDSAVRQGRLIALIIGLSATLILGVGVYFLSRGDFLRLSRLSKATTSIAEGDYSIRVPVRKNDEITDVGESFNSMAEKVQATLAEMIETQDAISENFATILEAKSGESGHHVKRVSEYSGVLARQMGFSESDVHDIKIASMLHDVGKIMVPNSVLEKPGRLTDEEYKIIQQHVAYGDRLLNGVPGNIMQLGAKIAGCHHERWDGKGYVKGLVGDQIPREAQLVSVADVFDALTSRRSYKKPWTMDDAYQEILSQRGKQFSPEAVDAFAATFEQFKEIAELYKDEAESDGLPENKA